MASPFPLASSAHPVLLCMLCASMLLAECAEMPNSVEIPENDSTRCDGAKWFRCFDGPPLEEAEFSATPILAVTVKNCSPTSKGWLIAVRNLPFQAVHFALVMKPFETTMDAFGEPLKTKWRFCPTLCSAPLAIPRAPGRRPPERHVSLTSLKWSMSRNSKASVRPERTRQGERNRQFLVELVPVVQAGQRVQAHQPSQACLGFP